MLLNSGYIIRAFRPLIRSAYLHRRVVLLSRLPQRSFSSAQAIESDEITDFLDELNKDRELDLKSSKYIHAKDFAEIQQVDLIFSFC